VSPHLTEPKHDQTRGSKFASDSLVEEGGFALGCIGPLSLDPPEEEGRRRGCTRIALTTLSIEAPGFYQKQGYDVAATIDCEPPGLTRYYMMKKL
jgi:hypothetical protein